MNYSEYTDIISSRLALDSPPVALSFVESPPAGIDTPDGDVPAGCAFWRKAETGVFYAPAEAHFNCPIGSMTMGFDMPPNVMQELMSLVENMTGCGYIGHEEAAKIPSIPGKKSGIVYGPLAQFSAAPDLVLLWLLPRQAMIFQEAAGRCRWTETIPSGIFGRPACAALPIAKQSGQATLSLGCTGMRTFTEIADNRMLAIVPGDQLERFSAALEKAVDVNTSMKEFYSGRKRQFSQ
jgi:uncharacterized protein (DUF169 family)